MAKAKLTPDELKDLEDYLKESDALAEQEPEHMEDILTPEEYDQVSDYLLTGKGDRPAAADRFTVTEVMTTDRDGVKRKHKTFYDTELENWNKKCADLYEKHQDTIAKALSIWLVQTDQKGGLQTTTDIVRSLLDKNPPPADFFNLPSSPVTSLIEDVLNYGGDIKDLPAKKHNISHGTKNKVYKKGNTRRIVRENNNNEISAELADIYKFLGSNEAANNLFVLSLIKADEQALHNGHLDKEFVTFSLQELVDLGMYKTVRSARNGFNTGADALTSIKIKGHETRKNGETATTNDALEVLFTGARIKNGQCYLFLNKRINWGFIAEYYTILPRYYFKLPPRAKSLLLYIFSLARQHTKDIEDKGYFTISFRAIQSNLNIPSETGSPNPRRDTVGAIEKAVEEIENANHEYFHSTNLQLQPVYDDTAPVSDCMDNGYLKVTLKGQYATFFVRISEKTGEKVAAAEKRKERIQDNAKAKALAKKMTSNTENDTKKDTTDT